jgi:hypothetical protein
MRGPVSGQENCPSVGGAVVVAPWRPGVALPWRSLELSGVRHVIFVPKFDLALRGIAMVTFNKEISMLGHGRGFTAAQ